MIQNSSFKLIILKKTLLILKKTIQKNIYVQIMKKIIIQMKMFKLLNGIWEKNYRWKNNPINALKRCKINVIFNLVLMKKTSKLNSRIFNIIKWTLNLKEYTESLELSFKVSINLIRLLFPNLIWFELIDFKIKWY